MVPYFYIIQHIASKKYYAGSKYSIDADPNKFFIFGGYTTSSNTIDNIIQKEGLSAFCIRKVKCFTHSHEAYDYETRFLVRVNAASNDSFYNHHNNDFNRHSYGTPEFEAAMLKKYNVKNANDIPEVRAIIIQKALERYNNPEWRSTAWRQGIDKMKKTMSDPFWIATVGIPRAILAAQNSDRVASGKKCSETKLSEEWRSTIGKDSQEKRNIIRKNKVNRPIVQELRTLSKKYKLILGSGWSVKSDEFLENLLNDIKISNNDF